MISLSISSFSRYIHYECRKAPSFIRTYSHLTRHEYEGLCRVLELEPGASKDVIKQQYYKLSRKYHPDVNPSPEAKSKFLRVSNAYTTLRDLKDIPCPPLNTYSFAPRRVRPTTPYYRGRVPFNFELHQYEHYDKLEKYQRIRLKENEENRRQWWEAQNKVHGKEEGFLWMLALGWVFILAISLFFFLF